MNFSVHLDDATGEALEALALAMGKTRNAVIKTAVTALIASSRERPWPTELRAFLEAPGELTDGLTPFEAHRAELRPPREIVL